MGVLSALGFQLYSGVDSEILWKYCNVFSHQWIGLVTEARRKPELDIFKDFTMMPSLNQNNSIFAYYLIRLYIQLMLDKHYKLSQSTSVYSLLQTLSAHKELVKYGSSGLSR